jgi:uncharacterized lipoprotein NlpE involved in copper resistance
MKKKLLSAMMLCTLGLVGCGEEHDHDHDHDTEVKYNTADKVKTYLEGKTMVMEGANIPSHPNGFSEDVNYGSATQCYNKVTMRMAGGNFSVTSTMATVQDTGCDHVAAGELSFTSTAILVENVKADGSCFDITVTYNGFSQEGRGQISQDGKTAKLELFFSGQATGHRCAAGTVGAQTVTLNSNAFTGNAVQTYTIQ